jgi:regulator of protease activity HflC (stomatin/prohibitin superfamily)
MTPGDPAPAAADEIHDVPLHAVAGGRVLRLSVLALVGAVVLLRYAIWTAASSGARAGLWVGMAVLGAVGLFGLRGLARLAPGEAVVVQFLARYVGTLRGPGLWWVSPVTKRHTISTKIRTHQTAVLKVNDAAGVPVEVAMVVNWRVSDTAQALFVVEAFADYVSNQCEMALRHVVASHHYDPDGDGSPSLSTSSAQVGDDLLKEITQRVEPAGITVVQSEIIHLAYAPEIAHAMLRRQQAAAIVAARQQIIEGAVGMVELALERLDREHVVDLDEERKATMVSNLLVVLCSDHPTQPMVNAGSLYL